VHVVADQHDAISRRYAEQRDEADERHDRQCAARQEYHHHAPDQRERQVRHN